MTDACPEGEAKAKAKAKATVVRTPQRRGTGWSHSALEQRPQAAELAQSVTTRYLYENRGNLGGEQSVGNLGR